MWIIIWAASRAASSAGISHIAPADRAAQHNCLYKSSSNSFYWTYSPPSSIPHHPVAFPTFHKPHWFISSGRVVCRYTNTWTGGTCNKRKRREGFLKGGYRSKRRFLYIGNDRFPSLGFRCKIIHLCCSSKGNTSARSPFYICTRSEDYRWGHN